MNRLSSAALGVVLLAGVAAQASPEADAMLDDARAALAADAFDVQALMTASSLLINRDEFDEAIALLEAGCAKEPTAFAGSSVLSRQLADAYYLSGDAAAAKLVMLDHLPSYGDDVPAEPLGLTAVVALESGDAALAAGLAERAYRVSTDPEQAGNLAALWYNALAAQNDAATIWSHFAREDAPLAATVEGDTPELAAARERAVGILRLNAELVLADLGPAALPLMKLRAAGDQPDLATLEALADAVKAHVLRHDDAGGASRTLLAEGRYGTPDLRLPVRAYTKAADEAAELAGMTAEYEADNADTVALPADVKRAEHRARREAAEAMLLKTPSYHAADEAAGHAAQAGDWNDARDLYALAAVLKRAAQIDGRFERPYDQMTGPRWAAYAFPTGKVAEADRLHRGDLSDRERRLRDLLDAPLPWGESGLALARYLEILDVVGEGRNGDPDDRLQGLIRVRDRHWFHVYEEQLGQDARDAMNTAIAENDPASADEAAWFASERLMFDTKTQLVLARYDAKFGTEHLDRMALTGLMAEGRFEPAIVAAGRRLLDPFPVQMSVEQRDTALLALAEIDPVARFGPMRGSSKLDKPQHAEARNAMTELLIERQPPDDRRDIDLLVADLNHVINLRRPGFSKQVDGLVRASIAQVIHDMLPEDALAGRAQCMLLIGEGLVATGDERLGQEAARLISDAWMLVEEGEADLDETRIRIALAKASVLAGDARNADSLYTGLADRAMAAGLAPKAHSWLVVNAEAMRGLEAWDLALAAAERGLATEPQSESLQAVRAEALFKLGRYEEAAAAVEPLAAKPASGRMDYGWVRHQELKLDIDAALAAR